MSKRLFVPYFRAIHVPTSHPVVTAEHLQYCSDQRAVLDPFRQSFDETCQNTAMVQKPIRHQQRTASVRPHYCKQIRHCPAVIVLTHFVILYIIQVPDAPSTLLIDRKLSPIARYGTGTGRQVSQ